MQGWRYGSRYATMRPQMTEADRTILGEIRARVRAAMAYADLNWDQVAKEFDTSLSTVKRRLHRVDRNGDAYRRELAHLCKVPVWFMLEGFDATERPNEDELAEIRQIVRELQRRLDGGEEAPARRPA